MGVRRVHVLPTPLSSFSVYAGDEAGVQRLKTHPLLDDLALRMKTRVAAQVVPEWLSAGARTASAGKAVSLTGVAVIGASANVQREIDWLLDRGATEIFILPVNTAPPQRVVIHWSGEEARRATLAVAASVLRHVTAEATYIGILPSSTPDSQKPSGMRDLLDARSEAQAVHGLEMRTELRFGEVADELARQLGETQNQMLILGVTDRAELIERFNKLLLPDASWPMLVVYRPADAAIKQRKRA